MQIYESLLVSFLIGNIFLFLLSTYLGNIFEKKSQVLILMIVVKIERFRNINDK